MRIEYTPGQPPKFITEAETPAAIFKKLAILDDLFSETSCGCCNSDNIRYVERKIDNGSYLELRCEDCTAKLSFGQNKEGGGLFVKDRWDRENKCVSPTRGWSIYQRQGDQQETPKQQHRAQQGNRPPPDSGEDVPF